MTIESDAAEVHPARVVTAQRRHRARVRRRWVRSQLLTLVSIILVTVMAALAAWGLDYELLD